MKCNRRLAPAPQRLVYFTFLPTISQHRITIYIIVFALVVAVFWKMMEFAGDKLFHFTAQGRDPDDTMFDMIDGLIGGIVVAFFIARKHGRKL